MIPAKIRALALLFVLALAAGLLPAAPAYAQDGPVRAAASDPYWNAVYFNNTSLAGDPILTRTESNLDYNWGFGSPDVVVNNDLFSARWTRYIYVSAGTWRFTVTTDDGARLFIDDQLVLDQWQVQAERTFVVDRSLSAGHHLIRLEYFESTGSARIALRYELAGSQPPPPGISNWRGEYFNNRDLAGTPALVRDDANIDFDWGWGSPAPGTIQTDDFSVRWTRNLNFDAGNYRFTVTVDDGVRLWVNNARIIDEWREQSPRTFSGDIYLPGGSIPLRLEFFEGTQGALVRLSWQRIDGGGGGGGGGGDDNDDDDDTDWRANYFNNAYLSGDPVLSRRESRINYDWGYGSPDSRVKVDWFTVRWSMERDFNGGKYRFTAEVDDGVRVYVDGKLKLDKWFAQSRTKYTFDMDLDAGEHKIVVEYLERTTLAFMRFDFRRVEAAQRPPVGNVITCVPPQPSNYAWIKLYRLNGDNKWYSIGRGIGSIHPTGFLKIDGLPVDLGRFGDRGEPYKVEMWVNGSVTLSTGDYFNGQPEFRVRAFVDNYTPWGCSR